MNRCDKLYVIIGNNPMPNILSIATRIKEIGEVVCIYTNETENIFKNLKRVVNKKISENNYSIKIYGFNVENINDISEVNKQLSDKIILNNNNETIELNFTGGTKVLATAAFQYFKKKSINLSNEVILSYFDSENSEVNSIIINNDKERYCITNYKKLEDILHINSEDIIELHNIKGKINLETPRIKYKELSTKIFNEVLENRDKAIELLTILLELPGNTKKIKSYSVDKLIEVLERCLSISNLKYFSNIDDFNINKEIFSDMTKEEKKDYFNILRGFWLEEYIAILLLELKEEGLIDEVFSSITKKRNNKYDFEVDLIIYSNYTIKCISVTTMEKEEEAKFKLYEIKARASQLAGDETPICYINLCKSNKNLNEEYRSIWQEELKDSIIISHNDYGNIKEVLQGWIMGKGGSEI